MSEWSQGFLWGTAALVLLLLAYVAWLWWCARRDGDWPLGDGD